MSTRPQSPNPLTNFMLRLPGLNRIKVVKDILTEKLDHIQYQANNMAVKVEDIQDQVNNMTEVDTTCLEAILDLTESINALTNLIDNIHQESRTVDSQILDLTYEVMKTRKEMTVLREEFNAYKVARKAQIN